LIHGVKVIKNVEFKLPTSNFPTSKLPNFQTSQLPNFPTSQLPTTKHDNFSVKQLLVKFLRESFNMKLKEQNPFHFSTITIAVPLYFVLFLWFIYWIEISFGYNFAKYGIYPRTAKGLIGIFASPFIHGDLKHLFNNSVPVFVLMTSIFYFYRKVAFSVLIQGTLLLGILTWFIGRSSFHIGASGIIYLLFSFIFFSGLLQKHYRLIAVSLMVIFLYGGMIWYIFPTKEGISWEGHLSGLIIGLLYAIKYRKSNPKEAQYDWEREDYVKDKFDLQFDDDGNFIPLTPLEEIEVEFEEIYSNLQINYIYNKEEE